MSSLREIIDGKSLHAADAGGVKEDLFNHVKKAAHTKADYDVAKAKLATKLAPMQSLIDLSQQMHGPNPQNPNDPFQNPYMQEGGMGPGGVGQGMENQDDLARTGQMQKPAPGGVDNYLAKQSKGIPGQPQGDGNKKLRTPGQNLAQGKGPQRSTSGQKPGKTSQATDGKPVKKGKSIKVEVSDGDKMAAHGTSEGVKKGWDTRGRSGASPVNPRSNSWVDPLNFHPKGTDPRMDKFDRSQQGHDREVKDAKDVKKGVVPQGDKIDWRKYGVNPDAEDKGDNDPRMDRFDRSQRGHQREVEDSKAVKKGQVPEGDKIDWRKYGVNPDLPMTASQRAKMTAAAIKNGIKRCKTCKNFFNPTHPKAGKSHCPTCKGNTIAAAARSAGRKPESFRRVTAGGPGSGRHKEGDRVISTVNVPKIGYQKGTVLKTYLKGKSFGGGEQWIKVKHDDGSTTSSPGGNYKPLGSGSMAAKFDTTTKKGKKVLTTGDYHNNAGKSMPSVGIGLSGGHARRKKWIAAKTGKPSIGPFPSSLVKK